MPLKSGLPSARAESDSTAIALVLAELARDDGERDRGEQSARAWARGDDDVGVACSPPFSAVRDPRSMP